MLKILHLSLYPMCFILLIWALFSDADYDAKVTVAFIALFGMIVAIVGTIVPDMWRR